ncbi:hypothetical protein FOZ60_015320 [Perkinsus olseni]|uniref:Uncharacterized protein n=1 Tax=Perkinsus olseni TaxID=32597 RepID=A0A7J6N6V4_PEROL|nr:hypothetical protein FOZ60_015320 [Perkinsus olseni]
MLATILLLSLSRCTLARGMTSAVSSTGIDLAPGMYTGYATDVTKALWPDMTSVSLVIGMYPRGDTNSAIIYTGPGGRCTLIVTGVPRPFGNFTFRNKLRPGNCFHFRETHLFPPSPLFQFPDRSPRMPFCINNGRVVMYLDARGRKSKIYHLGCPLFLEKAAISELHFGSHTDLSALGSVPLPPASYQRTLTPSAEVVREAAGLDDSAMRSTWWGLTPGLYVGQATDVTRQCWPDMTNVSLVIAPKSAEPQMSSMTYTGRDGSILPIVIGYPRRYSTSAFQRRVHAGESFYYINAKHNSPKVAPRLSQLKLSPRIPFCLRGEGLVMFLEARLGAGSGKFSDLGCPLYLDRITSLTTAPPAKPDSQARIPSTSAVMAEDYGGEVTTGGHDSIAPGGRGEPEREEEELTRSKNLPWAKQTEGESGALHNGRRVLSGHRPAAVIPAASRGQPKAQTSSQGMAVGSNGGKATKSGTNLAVRNEIEKMGEKRKRSPERSSQADTQRAKQARAEDGRAVERLHRDRRPATGSRRLPRPFHKQGVTEAGKVVVEGRVKSVGGKMILSGPVNMTFESTLDHSFARLHLPGLHPISTHAGHNTYYGLRCYRPWQPFDGLSELTPELATAEGIMKISPLRMDNIYICINSGMWRIHLGEETVDGLGREVVLPLVDVDDPFDPLH